MTVRFGLSLGLLYLIIKRGLITVVSQSKFGPVIGVKEVLKQKRGVKGVCVFSK